MPVISAKQMIFSRVEPEYSPKREGGYQTVYVSAGINRDEVATIESRVSCFQPFDEAAVVRKQFFSLSTGKVVLTHTVSIEADPVIVDKDRRSGAFIAHCLVFTAESFQQTFNNPFKVFGQFQFITSPQEMVSLFDQNSGKEPPCEIQIDPHTGDSIEPVLWVQAPEIYTYARQVSASKEKMRQLLLLGSPQEIEQFLRAFITIISPEMRLAFSFSTNIDSCQIQSTDFGVIGTSEMPDGRFQTIRLSAMDSLPYDPVTKSDDLYVGWLLQNRDSSVKPYLEITSAQAISSAFQKKRAIPGFVANRVIEDFYSLYRGKIKDIVQQSISKLLSPKLAENIVGVLTDKPDFRVLLSVSSVGAIDPAFLAKACRQIILRTAPKFIGIEKAEWNVLSDFSEKQGDTLLGFWAACILENPKKVKTLVEKLSQDEFGMALTLLDAPIAPIDFVSQKHTIPFVESIIPLLSKMTDKNFCEIVYAICDVERANSLTKLSKRVSELDNKSLTEMEGKLKKFKDLAPEFEKAIKVHRQKLGAPAGLAGLFYKEKK